MARYAITRNSDGLVRNIIEWDGVSSWGPPGGHTARLSATAGVGDVWDGAVFVRSPEVPTPEQIEDAIIAPVIGTIIAFRDRTDYLTEPSFAVLPALSPTANAAQTRDYIIATLIPRINALSTGANAAVPRINVNTQAIQEIIKVLLFLAKRLMGLNG